MSEKPLHEPETILKGLAKEIIESDEFKEKLRELGPDKIRENILNGLARMEARARARASKEQSNGE